MKIIYVGGWVRSGSTIIENILNEIDDFIHVGELRFIWENGFIHNRCCGWVQLCKRWACANQTVSSLNTLMQYRSTEPD